MCTDQRWTLKFSTQTNIKTCTINTNDNIANEVNDKGELI